MSVLQELEVAKVALRNADARDFHKLAYLANLLVDLEDELTLLNLGG